MLDVCNDFEKQIEDECLHCQRKLKEANIAGNIKLPHTNERGVKVVHGARIETYRIQEYWWNRLNCAMNYVSRGFSDKHLLYDRNIE